MVKVETPNLFRQNLNQFWLKCKKRIYRYQLKRNTFLHMKRPFYEEADIMLQFEMISMFDNEETQSPVENRKNWSKTISNKRAAARKSKK